MQTDERPVSDLETRTDVTDASSEGDFAMSILVAAPSAQPVSADEPSAQPFRGLLIALLLSIPFWFLAVWAIGRFL